MGLGGVFVVINYYNHIAIVQRARDRAQEIKKRHESHRVMGTNLPRIEGCTIKITSEHRNFKKKIVKNETKRIFDGLCILSIETRSIFME